MMNCQRCVVAFEARMRGYDVTASLSWGDDDPMRRVESLLKVFDSPEVYRCKGKTIAEIERFIADKMTAWSVNSRAFVWFEYADSTYGHVIVVQLNENGFVNFGDPQVKSRAAFKQLNEAKFDSVKIMRVDGLNFTDLVKRCCVNRGERHGHFGRSNAYR